MSREAFQLHHIGIAVRDLRSAIPAYGDLFHYKLLSGPFDDPIQKVSVCFLSRLEPPQNDTLVELVAPLGTESPITRTLKKGGGLYHVCYKVTNIDAALAHLTGKGSLIVSHPVPAAAFEMRKIAWVMTEMNMLVELLEA